VFDATVKTDVGTFVFRMDTATSPVAVNNFVFLARYHFYDGIIFHRVIPGFVVQGGDPTGTGAGGPGYSFTGNTPPASCTAKGDCYATGDVALANDKNPTSDGSQFFIVVPGGAGSLQDNYTLIGKVTSGMNVVNAIAADGSSSGTPTKTHHMISVTIQPVAA
jgi:cyclophilin family peptidyl-prolyl cis-trans isomerase